MKREEVADEVGSETMQRIMQRVLQAEEDKLQMKWPRGIKQEIKDIIEDEVD